MLVSLGSTILLLHEAGPDPLLDVGFQHAEGRLVPLNGHLQGMQHPLGREEVGDDPLRNHDRLGGDAKRLRIQTEVDDQLFRRARDAAEIGVAGQCLGVVDLDLDPSGAGRPALGRPPAGDSPAASGAGAGFLLSRACLIWPRNTSFR